MSLAKKLQQKMHENDVRVRGDHHQAGCSDHPHHDRNVYQWYQTDQKEVC